MSEEQSDKSGTDPEDSEENFNQADITDYRNYEQIFRPRQRELNRTPEITDEEFYGKFKKAKNTKKSCLCGDLSQLRYYFDNLKTGTHHPNKCAICGIDAYSKCQLCGV